MRLKPHGHSRATNCGGAKPDRAEFLKLPRRPIAVVLDGVRRNYNIGALFRLCDAFLVERLIIGGPAVNLRKRKLVQAARGTQYWVPWEHAASAAERLAAAKSAGAQTVVVEQTSTAVSPEKLNATFPVCVVFGAEMTGVSADVLRLADVAVAIPMLGMANSINVATAAAIVLHRLSVAFEQSHRCLATGKPSDVEPCG